MKLKRSQKGEVRFLPFEDAHARLAPHDDG